MEQCTVVAASALACVGLLGELDAEQLRSAAVAVRAVTEGTRSDWWHTVTPSVSPGLFYYALVRLHVYRHAEQ
jgi:hypothetical protein